MKDREEFLKQRRRRVMLMLWGGVGQIFAFVFTATIYLAMIVATGDAIAPLRVIISIHLGFAVAINTWYYQEEIEAAKAAEAAARGGPHA